MVSLSQSLHPPLFLHLVILMKGQDQSLTYMFTSTCKWDLYLYQWCCKLWKCQFLPNVALKGLSLFALLTSIFVWHWSWFKQVCPQISVYTKLHAKSLFLSMLKPSLTTSHAKLRPFREKDNKRGHSKYESVWKRNWKFTLVWVLFQLMPLLSIQFHSMALNCRELPLQQSVRCSGISLWNVLS